MAKKEKQKKQYDAKKHIQMTGSDRVMNGGFYLFITCLLYTSRCV